MPRNPEDHRWSVWWLLGPVLMLATVWSCRPEPITPYIQQPPQIADAP